MKSHSKVTPKWDEPFQGHHWSELIPRHGQGDRDLAKLRFSEFRKGIRTWDELIKQSNNGKARIQQGRDPVTGRIRNTYGQEDVQARPPLDGSEHTD